MNKADVSCNCTVACPFAFEQWGLKMRFDQTYDYILRIQQASTPMEINAALMAFTQGYGIQHLIAGVIPGPGLRPNDTKNAILFAHWPDAWAKRFVAQGYVYDDPILATVQNRADRAFRWHDAVARPGRETHAARIMNEAAEHGLADGFAVPMTTVEGDAATISFGGERMDLPDEACGLLHLLGIYAVGRAYQLRSQPKIDPVILTTREQDVLRWVAEGKTDWEIGVILTIAESTVKTHMHNAMQKCRVNNRAALVAECLRRGIIR